MMGNWCGQHPLTTCSRSSGACGNMFELWVLSDKIWPSFFINSTLGIQDASPNLYAWKVYSGLFFYQLFLAYIMPGYKQEGLPVLSLGYKTLMYNCNALFCLYATMITASAAGTPGHDGSSTGTACSCRETSCRGCFLWTLGTLYSFRDVIFPIILCYTYDNSNFLSSYTCLDLKWCISSTRFSYYICTCAC